MSTGGRWRAYPAYRDSGVEWLGEVPVGWEVRHLKFVAAMKAGRGITSDVISDLGDYQG